VSDYIDTEDFSGPLPDMFKGAMAFVMRNLRKIQAGKGVNAPGTPEIPPPVFEELLVNALVHRDYMVSAPIRLFIFDNRIEIISPGHLPNNLTVEKIRTGNSNIRNPILVSYISKGLLPYRGLGSGIKRALEDWPDIDFTNDEDGCLFTATVRRKALKTSEKISPESTVKSTVKTGQRILEMLEQSPEMTIPEMSKTLNLSKSAIEKQIKKLHQASLLQRIGPDKGGHWEVLSGKNLNI
jgi:ATP-dependent DNA helicase RecG